jgi:hypothetical protein
MGERRFVTSTPSTAQLSTRSGHGTSGGAGSSDSDERAAVSTASRRRDFPGGSSEIADATHANPA